MRSIPWLVGVFLCLVQPYATAAPICDGRPLRSIEFSGRECTAICRVQRKQVLFVGDKVLFGTSDTKQGVAVPINGQTDLQNDELNIPALSSKEFPDGRNVGRATSSVTLPTISLSIQRQLVSPSHEVLADYREDLAIRLSERCDSCDVIQYRLSLIKKGKTVSSDFHQYWCRVGEQQQ